uniref:Uncharacterized protein n=1 Tax=Paulinella longichromatophora TaxID=1708747 RepID=A0A2H4ZQI7_9EUKA|nr:hypothetical protein PLO_818 [Paulinella longichromatophora]
MLEKSSLVVKRSISIYTIATEEWKNSAEREISDAITAMNEQLTNLEYEAYGIINEIRIQSITVNNPLLLQNQIDTIQQQVNARRAELEDQQHILLEQQRLIQNLESEDLVEQGQLEGFCQLEVGDNLIEKLESSILIRDGVIEAMKKL